MSSSTPRKISSDHTSNNMIKNDLQTILQEIGDPTKDEDMIIEKIQNFNLSTEYQQMLKDLKSDTDDLCILHLSAKTCRIRLFYYLIMELKFDKDVLSKSKLTPLHLLVKSNILKRQDLECHRNSKSSTTTNRYSTLSNKDMETMVNELFQILMAEKPVNINAQDEKGMTALHYAAIHNNYLAATLLVQSLDIDITIEDKKSMTPLHLACKNGNDDIAELLISHTNADQLVAHSTPDTFLLHYICKIKIEKLNIVKMILDKLKNKSNEIDYIALAFSKEDSNKQPMLHLAIENNHVNIVECLFDYNIDKDLVDGKQGSCAIHAAAKTGSISMLNVLEKYDAVSNEQNNSLENAMHIAAVNNMDKFIEKYLIYENQPDSRIYKCQCECEDSVRTPSVQVLNNKFLTPLLLAVMKGNLKAIKSLANDKNTKIEAKDINGNSVYQICAEFNYVNCFHYFLKNHFDNSPKFLLSANNKEETVLHTACRFGNIEIVNLVYEKVNESNLNLEKFLYAKNDLGQTCFHVSCITGFLNIIEYFLKDLKKISFVDQIDISSNTPLHLATFNGHAGIVSFLLKYIQDCNLRNEDNATALDLSCRKGFFEISKKLLSRYSVIDIDHSNNDYPLHVACNEGSHEVVRLLLEKGAIIDMVDKENKNCLDIAIAKGHRDVIKILLRDPKWYKLIRVNNDYEDKVQIVTSITNESSITQNDNVPHERLKIIENPQLVGLFEKQMWDIIELILDKCITSADTADFRILDLPVTNMSKHPLTIIARSGQENLVKHEATLLLLKLKWRYIPRLAYYFNLLIYTIFLILLSIYSINLADYGKQQIREIANSTNRPGFFDYKEQNTISYLILTVFILINLIKEAVQLLFSPKIAYVVSLKNWFENVTYILSLISSNSNDYDIQAGTCSFAILLAFFVLPLKMEKIQVVGLYVVAFCRILSNSLKFFPIFLIMLTGFVLSFKIRANFGVDLFEGSIQNQYMKGLSMVLGETDSNKMGLQDESILNYIVYFLFIGLMSVIILNLLVGIAVSDIKEVLDEADIRQINLKIGFVLSIQKSLSSIEKFFRVKFKILSMNFGKYHADDERRFIKILSDMVSRCGRLIKSKEHAIILVDPQKRIEGLFNQLVKGGEEDTQNIGSKLKNHFTVLETKLMNSNRRLQDNLNEVSHSTKYNFENLRQEIISERKRFQIDNEQLQQKLADFMSSFTGNENANILYSKYNVKTKIQEIKEEIVDVEKKFEYEIQNLYTKMNDSFQNLHEAVSFQTVSIKSELSNSKELMQRSLASGAEMQSVKNESNKLTNQVETMKNELIEIKQHILSIKRMP